MRADEIREGDIVEIDYITDFTKEHINEGKALVLWKGFNNQPLVRKFNAKTVIWDTYEHISKVVGHIDLEGYMDKKLEREPCEYYDTYNKTCRRSEVPKEPCEDAISRQAVLEIQSKYAEDIGATKFCQMRDDIKALPSVTPQPKIGHWISHSEHCKMNNLRPSGLGCYWWCSECDYGVECEYFYTVNFKHCPNCGAEMESEE